jgi:hypothetical protein
MPLLLLRLLRFAAGGLLMLSLCLPWFRVPAGVREDLHGGYEAVVTEPVTTLVFKAFLVLVLLSAWWIGNRHRRSASFNWTTLMIVCGCLLFLVITIAYPALTIQRCADVSAHAAWLQDQHSSLDGDVRTAQQYAYQPSQWEVDVQNNVPRVFEAIPTPESSFSALRLANFASVLVWLGFSPAFTQFASLGWFCGVFGSFLLTSSFSRTLRTKCVAALTCPDLRRAHKQAIGFAFGAPLLCLLCLVPVLIAGRELEKAQTAVLEGRYDDSLRHLDWAEVWMPVLAYHTDILYQRGWLDQKSGANSWPARLVSAIGEEREGFHARAAQHYAELLDPAVPRPVRDEAFRGALRLAIGDFNTGLVDRAAFRFTELLAIDPTSLKANYALQLADFRRFKKACLERDVAQFTAIYRCFQSREKGVVIAAAHGRLAELDFDFQDFGKLGDEMRAAVQP